MIQTEDQKSAQLIDKHHCLRQQIMGCADCDFEKDNCDQEINNENDDIKRSDY